MVQESGLPCEFINSSYVTLATGFFKNLTCSPFVFVPKLEILVFIYAFIFSTFCFQN